MIETLAIQGQAGSYHEAAAQAIQPDTNTMYCTTFSQVFAAIKAGEADGGVVAIDNNRIGCITQVFDYIMQPNSPLQITAETYLRIGHALLAPAGATLDTIKEIHSQAPALGQCSSFLEEYFPNARIIEQSDTARSAEIVAEYDSPHIAAIASMAAGALHGLRPIKENIQDDPLNITRFLKLVASDDILCQPNADKTSIQLTTAQSVGALEGAIKLFSEAGINLGYLQSRPIANSAFEQNFLLDFSATVAESRTNDILATLRTGRYMTKVLGSYKAAEIPIVDFDNALETNRTAIAKALLQREHFGSAYLPVPKSLVLPRVVTQERMAAMGAERGRAGLMLTQHPHDPHMMVIVDI